MSSSQFPLRQSGIYHNLPTFDPEIKGLKAVVCGATGISGFHAIRALLDTPDRWSTIYALSRTPLSNELLSFFSEQQRARIQHLSVDLTSTSEEIAKSLKDAKVEADYVFYYAYIQPKSDKSAMDPSAADDLIESNIPPLRKFLAALPQADIKPKRILLQTGGKRYGPHIGRVRTPLVESDPQPRHLAPNFYYPQEDLVRKYCEEHPETGWNIVHPCAIIGAVQHASMNAFLSFAVYAAVQAFKKEPLAFGGDFTTWQYEATHSTARMTGYLSEWAVLEDKCKNQAFNAQDGGPISGNRLFSELARWYGIDEVRGPESDDRLKTTITFAGGKDSPLGYGPPLPFRQSYTLLDWAAKPEVKETWDKIIKQSNGQITKNIFDSNLKDIFIGDFTMNPFGTLSMNKVRLFGFSGFVDTLEAIFEMFTEMTKLGVLPPMKVDAARPLV